jgi:hypothetical protein
MVTQRPTALFLDAGGVLLTNGWDRRMRRKTAETFHLDREEMLSSSASWPLHTGWAVRRSPVLKLRKSSG